MLEINKNALEAENEIIHYYDDSKFIIVAVNNSSKIVYRKKYFNLSNEITNDIS